MRFVINGVEVFDLPLLVVAPLGAALTFFILWVVSHLAIRYPPLIKGGQNEKPDGPRPPDPVGQGRVNELCKLLDNGWGVEIFANQAGSYTAVARNADGESVITDDFTPDKAFYRLVEKVTTGRIV